MPASTRKLPGGSAAVIGGLAVLILGAIAFALPPSAIETGNAGGYLVAHSQLSEQFAMQLGRSNYKNLIVDLTYADLDKDAFWRSQLAGIGKRRYPVWGWVDVSEGLDRAREVLRSVNLAGLYVFGEGSVEAAIVLRTGHGLKVVPVIAAGDAEPEMDYAIALDKPAFEAAPVEKGVTPVLLAAGLPEVDIMAAREKRQGGNYVVAKQLLFR